jgi:hypothetical protein
MIEAMMARVNVRTLVAKVVETSRKNFMMAMLHAS